MKHLPESLNLHVQGHLAAEDAARQARSAREILSRLDAQPGVVLGDEVGMGKTFVALAVAAAHVVADPSRPVVVMVPGNVLSKWARDANTFRSACLRREHERTRFRVRTADTGVGFLKLLDDPEDHRATVIVLAHGALHRKLADKWVKLATLQAAIKGREDEEAMRSRLARFAPMILSDAKTPDQNVDLYRKLLASPPSRWKSVLTEAGQVSDNDDDPVPDAYCDALVRIDLEPLHDTLSKTLPERISGNLNNRIKAARHALERGDPHRPAGQRGSIADVWELALRRSSLSFPLLILDEAHRVRNAKTQLAELLRSQNEELEAAGGQLAHRFDRMLFLTATPFQLGHAELINVLRRFESIRWDGVEAPGLSRQDFLSRVQDLHTSLDAMQLATDRLERTWKRMLRPDVEWAQAHLGDDWWKQSVESHELDNERVKTVAGAFAEANAAVRCAEEKLRPWVLRNARSQFLPAPYATVPRRVRIEGEGVAFEANFGSDSSGSSPTGGLKVRSAGALPFLLSARVATLPKVSRVFNEGLASSYEAMLDTKRDDDDDHTESNKVAATPITEHRRAAWYAARLRDAALLVGHQALDAHPKMKATVELAMSLWAQGEKVLIFVHYQQTGAALLRHLSEAMHRAIELKGAVTFACALGEVSGHVERMQNRIDKSASIPIGKLLDVMVAAYPALSAQDVSDQVKAVVMRFMRTATFLVRFGASTEDTDVATWVADMFDRRDASGMSLRELIAQFLQFLERMPGSNRTHYLAALDSIQTGAHVGNLADSAFGNDERAEAERAKVRLVPNVRRVYGETHADTKERLMLAFNTPFYPEILIASSVMAEGVDLHLNCRHIIHHDLDWNPSSLEQRTGRIDRLGAKAERCGRSIRVYLPYVEGCQDEKLFRVVMDRERWFGVVMGAEQSMARVLRTEPWELEKLADSVPVPGALVAELVMHSLAAT